MATKMEISERQRNLAEKIGIIVQEDDTPISLYEKIEHRLKLFWQELETKEEQRAKRKHGKISVMI